jgi:hypothetical protein
MTLALATACASGKAPVVGHDYGPEDGSKDDSATRPSSLTALSAGRIAQAAFSATQHYRAFTFSAFAGEKVNVFVNGNDGLDTVLFLYKVSSTGRPYGKPIATNDDTDDPSWTATGRPPTQNPYSSSLVGFELWETRTYAIVATTYDRSAAGTAQVHFEVAQAGPGDWDSKAKAVFLGIFAQPGMDSYLSATSYVRLASDLPAAAAGTASQLLAVGGGVVWRFSVDGKAVYAAMSEADDRFFASLFDGAGRWFAHGYAIAQSVPKTSKTQPPTVYGPFPTNLFSGVDSFRWDDNDGNDPTICSCGPDGDICVHIDGTTFYGENDCD